jgi:hypothetical protein
LHQGCIATRKLPINFNQADISLFEHELKKTISSTTLLKWTNVTVTSDGILFCGCRVLPESFSYFINPWTGSTNELKLLVKNHLYLFKKYKKQYQDVFWITDDLSHYYFHWMMDALPRLFTIRKQLDNATLLLPSRYSNHEFIVSSLKPFSIHDVKFVKENLRCKNFKMPTYTARTGNYNESLIRGLRTLYTDFYQNIGSDRYRSNKVYISRGNVPYRKVFNEEECITILEEYGFKTVYFEDHSFEEQVKIALGTQYLIANHGAGLTNMLFMKSGCSVLELRQIRDAHNNCYFALASALELKYFYQLCDSDNGEDAPADGPPTGNLIVDCQILRKNIEKMLAN